MGQLDESLAVFAKRACRGFEAKCGGRSVSAIFSLKTIDPFALQLGEKLLQVKDVQLSE